MNEAEDRGTGWKHGFKIIRLMVAKGYTFVAVYWLSLNLVMYGLDEITHGMTALRAFATEGYGTIPFMILVHIAATFITVKTGCMNGPD